MADRRYIIDGQRATTDEYNRKHSDSFLLRFPKGRKEDAQKMANNQGKSLNGYIMDLIDEDMKKDRE